MKIVIYDVETTSEKPASCRVVQVAALAVPLAEGEPDELIINTLCNPGVDISAKALEIHGIQPEQLLDKRPDTVEMQRVAEYVMDNRDSVILAGHNVAAFDIPILWRIAEKEKVRVPVIDTLICSARTLPDEKSHKLGNLHVSLGLGSAEGAHDALGDILMVKNLIEFFCNGLGMDPLELARWCSLARVLKVCHLGQHRGKLWGVGPKETHVPRHYIQWMLRDWGDFTQDMAATLRHHYGATVNPTKIIQI